MARHYSTKDFFRQMPNALLARYFHARGLFADLDFSALKESQPDALFAAWLPLPDHQRNALDAECQEIFEMSCEKGFRAILDEAEWHLAHDADARRTFVEKLAVLSNHFVQPRKGTVPLTGHSLTESRPRRRPWVGTVPF